MDRGGMAAVDLHEGLESTLVMLGHKLKQTTIRVVRDYDRDLPPVTGSGGELNQVWTNLLDNAMDALGERGTITIATRRDGDCAEVAISDDGPGIPQETVQRIFDPFFTTKEVGAGTGLGLSITYSILKEYGGDITVSSKKGKGATFQIELPFAAEQPPEAPLL
jgi:signal transduction histidine kinase